MFLNIRYNLFCIAFISNIVFADDVTSYATRLDFEPVVACIAPANAPLTPQLRAQYSDCLGWERDNSAPSCYGRYLPISVAPLSEEQGVQIKADTVSLYSAGRSDLTGHVEVRQLERIVSAETGYVYRDPDKHAVTRVELLNNVRFVEPDRLMYARKAIINPTDNSGRVEDVLYRFNPNQKSAVLPAWGRASFIERLANKNIVMKNATYSTCPPQHEWWRLDAKEIKLDSESSVGTAKNTFLRVGNIPVLYAPYLTFPASKKRKSGFLMPYFGYTNVSGYNLATPYYLNLAPNYDATIIPQMYSFRGLMMGGNFRFLTENSIGTVTGQFLPADQKFKQFLKDNRAEFPNLYDVSDNRWSLSVRDSTQIVQNLSMHVNFQQVSDYYFLQDFSTNPEIMTENQLLQQVDMDYTSEHWLLRGMVQRYQTIHPIDQSQVANIYQRLPQFLADGRYANLPFGADLHIDAQYDNFYYPNDLVSIPRGPRYHFEPMLSLPLVKSWGYFTPAVEFVENYYDIHYNHEVNNDTFNRTIPRYSVDSGLIFERAIGARTGTYTQTVEPRLYYLNVPYRNQAAIPTFESAYMIFSSEQLFRNNRFSGFDRIGDTNQLSYAVTSRFISDRTGQENASFTVGQIRYFSQRRVGLCYSLTGQCTDTPLFLGYLSPQASTSPIASHGKIRINSIFSIIGDYVYDNYAKATDNGNINFHFQPADNQILNIGYNYLSNGNLLSVIDSSTVYTAALHQATIALATPFTDNWSVLGAYNYNISKGYDMLSLLGVQYDNCCWAARLMGGRAFKSFGPDNLTPVYNNNIYFQILLKGLGTVGNSSPSSIISTYLPTYKGIF